MSSNVLVPRATKLYEELYGDDAVEEMPYFVDLVRTLKTSEPGKTLGVSLKMIGYPLNPKQSGASFFLSVEGFLQGISLEYFGGGVSAKHGAPIPIKRVIVSNNGRSRRMFASTFAILSKPVKEGDEYVNYYYAPFIGGFAKVEIDRDGLYIVDDTSILPLKYFTERRGVLRGVPFEVYYDYLRLGREPPKTIYGFVFQDKRGPMHNLLRHLDFVTAGFTFIFNFPNIINREKRRDLFNIIINAPQVRSSGYGYLGMGVISDYEVKTLTVKPLSPLKYLFANYNDKYWVSLRPIPRDLVDKKWIVEGGKLYRSINPNPPYYSAPRSRTPIIQYLPGVVFRELPNVEWEMW